MASTVPNQPSPLHKLAKPVKGDFLGSTATRDYYLSHDLDHVWIVRSAPGHKVISEQGVSHAILHLISWGEHDMANRIRAARAMLT
jgi:hypothetical protein